LDQRQQIVDGATQLLALPVMTVTTPAGTSATSAADQFAYGS